MEKVLEEITQVFQEQKMGHWRMRTMTPGYSEDATGRQVLTAHICMHSRLESMCKSALSQAP